MIPALRPGQQIRVTTRRAKGHVRTPGYLRGKHGRIIEVVGAFPDPNRLAQGELGIPYRMLYRVTFHAHDLWPDYDGGLRDVIVADLYEHELRVGEFADD